MYIHRKEQASMFYGYLEQIERLKSKLEEKDTSRLHILDLQRDGTYLDTATKIVYKDWQEVEKKMSGTIIIDDVPEDGEIDKGVQNDCE